jgi:anti-sigma B factor antagonist
MGTHRFTFFPESPSTPAAVLTYQTVVEHACGVRVAFAGEIDMSTADGLNVVVTDALRSYSPRHLCVDLAGVRFMDCSAIHALVRCRGRAADAGCRLTVTNPQPMVCRTLEITGLLEALAVTPADEAELVEDGDRGRAGWLGVPVGSATRPAAADVSAAGLLPSSGDRSAAEACRRDAVALRRAAAEARARAQAMLEDNVARRARMLTASPVRDHAGPSTR